MGEVKQTNFRVDQDTADKFREFCAAAGMNQAQGFDHMMQVLELDRAKEAVPSRATEIEEYEMHVKAILSAYTNSLAINNDAEERVKEQFSASLESKDKTIQDLQGQIAHLKEEKETAAQSMKEAAAATEKAESASQLVAEKDRTIGTLAEKLATAEAKSEGYDALEQKEKESQEQIRTLQLTIEEQKKDHAAEMKDLQRDTERKISDAQKDAELEVVSKVAEKERELNVKMLQLERENAKLQAKIEILEEKLQSKE